MCWPLSHPQTPQKKVKDGQEEGLGSDTNVPNENLITYMYMIHTYTVRVHSKKCLTTQLTQVFHPPAYTTV